MHTSIEFVNHASVIIKGENISILSDPWFFGDAFHKGWNLLYETPDLQIEALLSKITHIWISHEHPDHFSISFFKKYSKKLLESSVKILYQNTKDLRVINFLRGLSLECIELDFNVPLKLSEDFRVICIKDGFYDSALLIINKEEKILNLNDCDISTDKKALDILSITGEVDVLLTQFSYAAWKGGRLNKKWRLDAANDKLNSISIQVELLKPRFVVPFASYVYFSNEDNFYLNDSINQPIDVLNRLSILKSRVVILKPGDIFDGFIESNSINSAIEFWSERYSEIFNRKLNCYQLVDDINIRKNFINYCDRISKNNSILFIKLLRFISPISIFQPVIINVTDLNVTYKFDFVTRMIELSNEEPMLYLKSESIDFLFKNSYGFDTLTVNGCFEEGSKGGFIGVTKTLALENLNNLGIFMNFSLFLNLNVIKLFISRLFKVAKMLNV